MKFSSGAWWIAALVVVTLPVLFFGTAWWESARLRSNDPELLPPGFVPESEREDQNAFRSIAARIVGERHLPLRRMRSGMSATIAEPLRKSDVRATSMLLNGQTAAAIQKLREEAKSGDPAALTNLAAALLTQYDNDRSGNGDSLPLALEALVTARRAIAKSPTLAAAHFNLALALECVGFTPEARAEFEAVAVLESSAAWIAEARSRAARLRESEHRFVWLTARRYVDATTAPASRRILEEYLNAREGKRDRSRWNDADVHERLARAADIGQVRLGGDHRLASDRLEVDELLSRLFSRLTQELSPREGIDPYAHRYYVAGELHRRGRTREAIDLLRTLDSDAFSAKRHRGWAAQILCERAMQMIVRGSAAEAFDLFRTAYHGSAALGERTLATMYVDLANEVRVYLLQAALLRHDIPAAFSYTGTAITTLSHGRSPRELTAVQHALSSHGAIVEYTTLRDQVIVFVIRKDDVQVVTLDASAADVRNAADDLRRADDDSFATAAATLHDVIVAPVESLLEGVSAVAFVSYRDLLGIPFGTLFDVQRGQFLIERFAVTHAQSTHATITSSRAARTKREPTVLAIAATDFDHKRYADASALPAAGHEAANVAALSRCGRVLSGPAATADAIQRQLVENAVIHYAGHIVRRGADVWLPLMPAAGRHGLSATEIARLPLENVRVVVLAGCRGASTGESQVMPSMADAFLSAGVPTVIASSYEVDDADAPATMQRLHSYLRDGDDAAEALRKTAIAELRSGRGVPLSLRFMAIGGGSSLVE